MQYVKSYERLNAKDMENFQKQLDRIERSLVEQTRELKLAIKGLSAPMLAGIGTAFIILIGTVGWLIAELVHKGP